MVGKFTNPSINMDINGQIDMISLLLVYGQKCLKKEIKYVYVPP